MGALGSAMPRVVLESPVQLYFRAARVRKEVSDLLRAWFEDGATLGLVEETFRQCLNIDGREDAPTFFAVFDTDDNKKVDALEVFAALILLSSGTVDEKVEAIFPVFDFSGTGKISFHETNIFVHSVHRGVQKVCDLPLIPSDNDLVDLCKSMFDAYNLPYDKLITREQLKRWLRSDVDAASFVDAFQRSCSLPEVEATLAEMEQAQAAAFDDLPGAGAGRTVPAAELSKDAKLRTALGTPTDQALQGLLDVIVGSGKPFVGAEGFATGVRAWNVFRVVDDAGDGEVDAKELGLLLRLWRRGGPPSAADLEARRAALGLPVAVVAAVCGAGSAKIILAAWLRAALDGLLEPVAAGHQPTHALADSGGGTAPSAPA
eukprot:TRINITY_DN74055_c0_g1_i1.p1 TRINITY_DN74055_c0_g1~~TRINITY_DN74055_c0_g1_i1.p1  ORF type:complete len:397 (+),score=87.36 TRINITY_DN74055_c0_g1_i1:69-1193(+)